MVNDMLLMALMSGGIKHVGRINSVLLEADDLRALDDKQLAVATTIYAAALANMTKLNLEDFVALAIHAYSNVEVGEKNAS